MDSKGTILLALAIIAFYKGVRSIANHDIPEAKKAIIAAVLLAFAWAFVSFAFRSAGLPVIDIFQANRFWNFSKTDFHFKAETLRS